MAGAVRLLQLTDCHLKAAADAEVKGCVTEATLAAVVASALDGGDPPTAILATGDISQDGSAEAYERFRDRLGVLGLPVMTIPGNHDNPDIMARVLSADPFSYCDDAVLGDWRVITLSTWDGDRGGGRLGPDELGRLRRVLARAEEPHVLVVLHHHPVPVKSKWLDSVALDDAAEFHEILDASPSVRCVLWGHVHQAHDSRRNNVRYLGTPSTCFQFRPGTDVPEVDDLGPAWRVLDLLPDGSIDTRIQWVPRVP